MYDEQKENGTDEAPARDVRWEGTVARMENKAHEHTKVRLDWKLIEVSACDLERLIKERAAYQEAVEKARKLHTTDGSFCKHCEFMWPCDTIEALGDGS